MPSPASHPAPTYRAVILAQLSATRLALRTEGMVYFAIVLAIHGLILIQALRAGPLSGDDSLWARWRIMFVPFPAWTLPIVIVGGLLPLSIWRAEEPDRRDYLWNMPVPFGPHTLIKTLCGWGRLIVAVAGYLSVVLPSLIFEIRYGTTSAPWSLVLAPLTTATIAYLLSSAIVLRSNHPWRWFGGVAVGAVLASMLLPPVGLPDLGHAVASIFTGSVGLVVALRERQLADYGAWWVATCLWLVIGAVGVWIAAYRTTDR